MRYSSQYRRPSSSPDLDDLSYSPAHNNLLPLDLYTTSCGDYDATPDFMSAPLFNFNDPSLGLDFDSQDLDSLPLQAGHSPSLQDSVLSSAASQPVWQFYGNNAYPQNYQQATPSNLHVQQQIGQHRRALSNSSSVPSYAPDSPYSRASSVQYPAAYPSGTQYLHPSWDGYSSPISGAQHLPTPSHTPKSDSAMMDSKAPRRNTSLTRADSAHKSLRLSNRKQSSSTDLPLTPRTVNGDDSEGQSGAAVAAARNIPKFNRTISDVCQDELYNPNGVTSAPLPQAMHPTSHQQAQQMYNSPQQNHLISQRLSEANMGRAAQYHDNRQPTPFRYGSVYAGQVPYTAQPQPQTAAAMRDQSRVKMEALALQQQQQQQQQQNQQQPQTVSPKDTFPEQPEPREENLPSLFPTGSSQSDMTGGTMYAPHNAASQNQFLSRPGMSNGSAQFSFATPSLPTSSSQEQQSHHTAHATAHAMADFPAHLASMETTKSEHSERTESPDTRAERPADTSAGSGTYTCTYHGCTERFAVPAQLQRHKRDAHRSTGAGGVASPHSRDGTDAQSMTQAGPHKCSRINPSTGKPCNTIFSRPYDLTRHEDTIHAERKKVRCPHCTDEKTFSRADALTRHLRVVHPHVAFSGKQRRRNVV